MRANLVAILALLLSCSPEFTYRPMPVMGTDALMCAVVAKIPVDSMAMTKPDFKSVYIDSASAFTSFGKTRTAPGDGLVISLPRASRYNGYAILLDTVKAMDSAIAVDVKAYVDTVKRRDSLNSYEFSRLQAYRAKHKSDFFRGTMLGSAITAVVAGVLAIVIAVAGR